MASLYWRTASTKDSCASLSASTAPNIIINNSGTILGDVLFGSAGNGDTLNVGNVGGTTAAPTANPATGVVNSPSSYAVIAETIVSQTSGQAPITDAAVIDFGGFLGVGTRKIAVDWSILHFPKSGPLNKLITDLPRDRLQEAPAYKETIFVYAPKSTGAEEYRKLAQEVVQRVQEDRVTRSSQDAA